MVRLGLVQPGIVWKLKKALYGLRTSPKAWEEERDQKLGQLQWETTDGRATSSCKFHWSTAPGGVFMVAVFGCGCLQTQCLIRRVARFALPCCAEPHLIPTPVFPPAFPLSTTFSFGSQLAVVYHCHGCEAKQYVFRMNYSQNYKSEYENANARELFIAWVLGATIDIEP